MLLEDTSIIKDFSFTSTVSLCYTALQKKAPSRKDPCQVSIPGSHNLDVLYNEICHYLLNRETHNPKYDHLPMMDTVCEKSF